MPTPTEPEKLLSEHYGRKGRWFSPMGLARRWDCHPSTVYRLLSEGRLPFLKVGGALRVSSVWVERFEIENLGA